MTLCMGSVRSSLLITSQMWSPDSVTTFGHTHAHTHAVGYTF